MKKIGILGAKGRMGQMIAREILSGQYGAELGASADLHDDKEIVFKNCDVVVDFTAARACADHAALARRYQKPLVIGTTGLSAVEEEALLAASKKTAVLRSSNMSIGISLLLSLVEQAAARLNGEFDIEIFEAHHRHKADAPSGTALALGRAAAKGRGIALEDAMIPARFGHTGERIPGSIGMAVFRGGDVVGEHTVTFAGTGERLEFTHKASDRAIFAKGAVAAALWLAKQPPGLYSMADVLQI